MRVWIDLSNSPHVALFEPIVDHLTGLGWKVVLSARNHAQTATLAKTRWPDIEIIGGESPSNLSAKATTIVNRTRALRVFASRRRPNVALSHGSYAQIVAARLAKVPTVTMMDYEYQPANHLSFRLASQVVVPDAFPCESLRHYGASLHKVVRYAGFKEELYLAGFEPDHSIVDELGLDVSNIIAVMRPPPEGALYHRDSNQRFDELVEAAVRNPGVQLVLLPRDRSQEQRYRRVDGIAIPNQPIDGLSLLACADVAIGAGGTMNRESALLGTPTYTVFSGKLAAVDAALIRAGLLRDLRAADSELVFERKPRARRMVLQVRRDEILAVVTAAITKAAR